MEEKGSNSNDNKKKVKKVGLVYDDKMCNHSTPNGADHPECPDRIRVILDKLAHSGLFNRCEILNAKEAKDKYLQLVHSKSHVDFVRTISSKQFDSRRKRIASKFNSIYLNKGSSQAAYLAAGSVLEAAEKVAKGDLDSAFAIVRPPGHHAEENEPMGFCLFNHVAVAASYLLNERPELGIKKILIVDWDVHHGNGTQKMFWKDSRVLFFSVHRHDFGCFFPGNDDASHTMIGEGTGEGYNINVPWEHGQCGDSDYFAVLDYILTPVTKEFNPDLIIVSAGFDAAVHDPLGGCCVTPYGYSVLLRKLMDFAQGKLVLALEGGYNLQSLANSAHACVQTLLEKKPINGSSEAYPFESTWRVIKNVRKHLRKYWPSLSDELPEHITSRKARTLELSVESSSDSEMEDVDELVESIVPQPLSKVSVDVAQDQKEKTPSAWREEFDQVLSTLGLLKEYIKEEEFDQDLSTLGLLKEYIKEVEVSAAGAHALQEKVKALEAENNRLVSERDTALGLLDNQKTVLQTLQDKNTDMEQASKKKDSEVKRLAKDKEDSLSVRTKRVSDLATKFDSWKEEKFRYGYHMARKETKAVIAMVFPQIDWSEFNRIEDKYLAEKADKGGYWRTSLHDYTPARKEVKVSPLFRWFNDLRTSISQTQQPM